ncbi:phycobiliprotein lyase [Calothrix rhizosoleniae]|uniref:phycobiliprotein lyase n=1 Tax=Calothrix rhizosoleniae TaxID=888997 RepID=UPI000B49AF3A|nr:phycobiliprotein lyase [Calothrix rhizosoleniae]
MDITQFVDQSLGRWRSQRSAHHLAFGHFEAVESTIDIVTVATNDQRVIELCKSYDVDPQTATSPFQMSWKGHSDWDDDEVMEGSCVLVPIPDRDRPNQGKLLRDQGYAETVPAAGNYHLTDDGTFVLLTAYDRAAAEEKIWFVNPNLRCRVSLIKTSNGAGVVTASFSSEIRSLSNGSGS